MKLEVASPCKRDWAKMSGGDAVRFCGDCRQNVYNLSVLTQEQLDALVKEKEGRVCVRFFTRPDGTVLTKDCPVGVTRKRRTYAFSIAAMLSLLAAPFVARTDACETGEGEVSLRQLIDELKLKLGLPVRRPMPEMGKMMVPPPSPSPPPPSRLSAP